MGQTKSLNVGLRLASGKYIVVNDADDYSLPKRIETQLDFIAKNPEYPVVGTSCYIMDKQGRIAENVPATPPPAGDPSAVPERHSHAWERHHAEGSCFINGRLRRGVRIIQDYELWSKLMRNGLRVMNISEILVVIRTFADSISFKERDAQTIENGKTIQANIEAMAGTTDLPGRCHSAEDFFPYRRSVCPRPSSTARAVAQQGL